MTNNADPDQLASSDLDLHCLQRQGISEFSRTRVKNTQKKLNNGNKYLSLAELKKGTANCIDADLSLFYFCMHCLPTYDSSNVVCYNHPPLLEYYGNFYCETEIIQYLLDSL